MAKQSKFVPDQAILDINGKQSYLGNSYEASLNNVGLSSPGFETPILLIQNPLTNLNPSNTVSLFNFVTRVGSAVAGVEITFKLYNNPNILTTGNIIAPLPLRFASGYNSVMLASSFPTTTGVNQVQTVITNADGFNSHSLNNKYFYLQTISPTDNLDEWYVWFNVSGGGTDPAIAGRVGIEVSFSTSASANTVATAIRAALNANAPAVDVLATGSGATVIITDLYSGAAPPALDGAKATDFTFQNTLDGTSNFGIYQGTISTTSNPVVSSIVRVLDPGQSLLITASPSVEGAFGSIEYVWYELNT